MDTTIPEVSNETALLNRWRAGDRDAGSALLGRYIPTLTTFFRRRTNRNVEDLVQRTLVVSLDAVNNFEGRSSFKSFLLGIARNQFLKGLPAGQRANAEEEPSSLTTFPEDSPSQLLASKQELEVLLEALTTVGSPFREVLRMFYWEGMSIDEIAAAMSISQGTVKSRLGRGRAMLKDRLIELNAPQGVLVQNFIGDSLSNFGNLSGVSQDSMD
ncbi:MAG TPA: RNA polymerase sigma factor, partial [Polyangiaceae bacterium]